MVAKFAVAFIIIWVQRANCRDEAKIVKACYWPNEVYEPCFGGCAEVSCDNPRNHLRPCYPYCEPGCVCEEPYVRDDRTHQCVMPQDCSPTQMGIPVATKRPRPQEEKPAPNGQFQKYNSGRTPRPHREDNPPEYLETDPDIAGQVNKPEDPRRSSDVSRMGNYFNIVIAPPPIKALQPRKMLNNNNNNNNNNAFITTLKRL